MKATLLCGQFQRSLGMIVLACAGILAFRSGGVCVPLSPVAAPSAPIQHITPRFVPAISNGVGVLAVSSSGWNCSFGSDVGVASISKQLLDAGYTIFVVRHVNGNMEDVVDSAILAAKLAITEAAENGIDRDHLIVMGGSSSGHLALLIGQRFSLPIIARSPVSDLNITDNSLIYLYAQQIIGMSLPQGLAMRCSPLNALGKSDPPMLLFHAVDDSCVPIEQSRAFMAAARARGVDATLIEFSGHAHAIFSEKDEASISAASIAWIEAHNSL
jgi:dienelactone hydrolase